MNSLSRNVFLWILPFFLLTAGSEAVVADGIANAETTPAAPIQNNFKRYAVKSAIIEYALSGVQTGTETVYIDDWGRREARYTQSDMNMMGQTMKANRLTLIDGEWIYAIDLDKKSGTKIKNPMLEMAATAHQDGDLTQMGIEMMTKMGGVKTGTEEVAGKPCDVWEIKAMSTKSWIWNSIPLKTEASMGEMSMASTATKVEEGAAIPQEKLALPSDVQISDGQQFAQMMESMRQQQQEESLEKDGGPAA